MDAAMVTCTTVTKSLTGMPNAAFNLRQDERSSCHATLAVVGILGTGWLAGEREEVVTCDATNLRPRVFAKLSRLLASLRPPLPLSPTNVIFILIYLSCFSSGFRQGFISFLFFPKIWYYLLSAVSPRSPSRYRCYYNFDPVASPAIRIDRR